jgi:DNA gyrase inhibitor GyrI
LNGYIYLGSSMVDVKLVTLDQMIAATAHSLVQNPEEDALQKITSYAAANGLTGSSVRLFGRNIYLTDKPEPHGYEYYLTVQGKITENSDVSLGQIPGGLYAVMEIKNLFAIGEGWQNLFSWLETHGYQPVGVSKGKYGWVNSAYEELVDWQSPKPPTEWTLRLMAQLKR